MIRRRLALSLAGVFTLATLGVTLPAPAATLASSAKQRSRANGGVRITRAVAQTRSPAPPASNPQPGRAGAEAAALLLTQRAGGLPVGPDGVKLVDPVGVASTICPPYRLAVSWTPPTGNYKLGGYLTPLGPPPTATTTQVNGVVVCRGVDYAYLGFEAMWDGTQWTAIPVPGTSDDSGDKLAPAADTGPAPTPAQPTGLGTQPAAPGTVTGAWGAAIEALAPYQPQSTCDPTPKPGVVGLKNLLLSSFAGSTDLGIGQACDAPDGVSEHKEGRAFDWGVNITNPAQKAMAEQVLSWLFATDQYGNQYAMIRRLGIMYIIWDRHIWGAYAADQGWRDYVGVSPHTDHIHISFDWAGALGQTSFWTGQVGAIVGPAGPVAGAVPPYVAPPAPAAGPAAPQVLAAGAPQNAPAGNNQPQPAGGSPQAAPVPESDQTGGSGSTGSSSPTTSPSSSTTTTTTTAPPRRQPSPPPPTTPSTTSPPTTSPPPPSSPSTTLLPPLPLH